MTTFEPGARGVFTQGLRSRAASTALRASSAAPIMTDGLEVLVQEVMAAMTTEPWSTSVCVPSSGVTMVGWGGRGWGVADGAAGAAAGASSPSPLRADTGSDAGKVPA